MRRSWLLVLLLSNAALAASSVELFATWQAGTLQLDAEGASLERIVKVADLHIRSDAPLGFTLVVPSGHLTKTDGEAPVPFQVVTVAEGASAPAASDFTSPSGEAHVYRIDRPGNFIRQLYIRYIASPRRAPGTYSTTVVTRVIEN